MKDGLGVPLTDDVDGWINQFEIGRNSADVKRLPDLLKFLTVQFRCHQLVVRREVPNNGKAERTSGRLKATLLSEP